MFDFLATMSLLDWGLRVVLPIGTALFIYAKKKEIRALLESSFGSERKGSREHNEDLAMNMKGKMQDILKNKEE